MGEATTGTRNAAHGVRRGVHVGVQGGAVWTSGSSRSKCAVIQGRAAYVSWRVKVEVCKQESTHGTRCYLTDGGQGSGTSWGYGDQRAVDRRHGPRCRPIGARR